MKLFRIPTILLAAWMIAGLFALGCADDSLEANASNGRPAYDAGADTGEAENRDASGFDTASDAGADASDLRRYDAALADLGPPSSSCSTEVVNAEGRREAVARVFVPNYRLDLDVLDSHAAFREHIHRLIHEKVVPCIDDSRPTVVVFPESMGLPMLFIGDKAASARQMDDSANAFTSLVSDVEPAFNYYGEKFPDTPVASRSLLAMTDTVVRATYDTFGQLAERYDLYISTTVDLPDFEKTTDARRVDQLGDFDYAVHDYAYEATSPEVQNRQVLFGPDGTVVDQTLKTYVSQTEIEQFDLASGDFRDIHTMSTPWGATGVVISESAWMPDVQDRLDDLGAQVIFQPESSADGWIQPPPEDSQSASRWEPDVFMLGAWHLVQRSPRATHGFVAQMTGNFMDRPFDGQIQMIEKAAAQPPSDDATGDRFVGQRGPVPGNLFIGPWVVEDPVASDPEMSLEARRAELRDTAAKLLPGSGDPIEGEYVEGMWAAELSNDGPDRRRSVQTHPSATRLGDALFVASSNGVVGQRELRLQRLMGDGQDESHDLAVDGYDLIRPSIAADHTSVHIVAELIGDGENRLFYAAFDPDANDFVAQRIIDTSLVGRWAFHPSLVAHQDSLHLSWIQRVGEANRAYYGQTSLRDPFTKLTVDTPVEPRPSSRPPLRSNQWDARLAVDEMALAVTWLDFQNGHWEVLAAVSTDGGLNWSPPTRLDAVPSGVEALNSTPTIRALGDGQFLAAWTEGRTTRPATRIGYRSFDLSRNGEIVLDDPQLVDASAPYDQWHWRPALLDHAQGAAVVFESLGAEGWSLKMARLNDDFTPARTSMPVEASSNAKHFPVVEADGQYPVVVYEQLQDQGDADSALQLQTLSP
ncbi:MAG: hypothetical protein ACLFVJ_00030 [Persicimonas sp.]